MKKRTTKDRIAAHRQRLDTIENKIDMARSEVMRAKFPSNLLLIGVADFNWMRDELVRLQECAEVTQAAYISLCQSHNGSARCCREKLSFMCPPFTHPVEPTK
jgi:hypothetical protein